MLASPSTTALTTPLPDTVAAGRWRKGIVVAPWEPLSAEEGKQSQCQVARGDIVVFKTKHAGFEIAGDRFVIPETDIIAIEEAGNGAG